MYGTVNSNMLYDMQQFFRVPTRKNLRFKQFTVLVSSYMLKYH